MKFGMSKIDFIKTAIFEHIKIMNMFYDSSIMSHNRNNMLTLCFRIDHIRTSKTFEKHKIFIFTKISKINLNLGHKWPQMSSSRWHWWTWLTFRGQKWPIILIQSCPLRIILEFGIFWFKINDFEYFWMKSNDFEWSWIWSLENDRSKWHPVGDQRTKINSRILDFWNSRFSDFPNVLHLQKWQFFGWENVRGILL